MLGFSAFVLNLINSGKFLCRKMSNGNCLFSSVSLLLVGDNTLVHELRVLAAVELHVNSTYYVQYPAVKSIYGIDQSVIAGKLFSFYVL